MLQPYLLYYVNHGILLTSITCRSRTKKVCIKTSSTSASLSRTLSSESFGFFFSSLCFFFSLHFFFFFFFSVSFRVYISVQSHSLPIKTIKELFTCHLVLLTASIFFFLVLSKIKADASSIKSSGQVTLLTGVLLGCLAALTA